MAIASCELFDNAFKKLPENSIFALPSVKFENVELIARVNDMKFILNNEKVKSIKNSVVADIDIYKRSKHTTYVVRAMQLIKKEKAIFSERLSEYREFLLKEILG